MTTTICPHCNQPVQPAEPRRVCGLDLRSGIPTNIVGHRACAAGRDPVIVR
jgi:hypothetical protein